MQSSARGKFVESLINRVRKHPDVYVSHTGEPGPCRGKFHCVNSRGEGPGRKSVSRAINTGLHFTLSPCQTAKLVMVLSSEDEIALFISFNVS